MTHETRIDMLGQPVPSALVDQAITHAPPGGWKLHSLYLVAVSYSHNNFVHEAYLHVGFINHSRKGHADDVQTFGSYCEIWCNSYDRAYRAGEAHFLTPLALLHTEEKA